MKIYVNQNKIRIMMNVGVIVKNKITEVLAKKAIYGLLMNVIVNVIKHVKLVNI